MTSKQKKKVKRKPTLKVPVWIQLIDGKPDRVYWQNPQIKDFEVFRLTMEGMYGKNLRIIQGYVKINL